MKGLGDIAKQSQNLNMLKTGMLANQAKPEKAHKQKEGRAAMPKVRIFGGMHPNQFAHDITRFVAEQKIEKGHEGITQLELLELAFYEIRRQATGEPIPNWVTRAIELESRVASAEE